MRQLPQCGIDSTRVTVLSVSPMADDHTSLDAIFKASAQIPFNEPKWELSRCASVDSAIAAVRQARIPIVVTQCDLAPGSWRDILNNVLLLPDPPFLIVTSRLADEALWAEALNLGAYDVLAKPFDASEVMHALGSAWRHWADLHERIQVRPQMVVAAGVG